MEEEIICNRWKDLADGPKGRESGPSVMVFLSSGEKGILMALGFQRQRQSLLLAVDTRFANTRSTNN